MSRIIKDAEGSDAEVYTRDVGGRELSLLRAEDKATMDAWFLAQGSTIEVDGVVKDAPGANIDRIGPVVLVAAVIVDGVEITPDVTDPRYHANLFIDEPMLSSRNTAGFRKWKVTAINQVKNGANASKQNKNERVKHMNGIDQIDPDSVNTPKRKF